MCSGLALTVTAVVPEYVQSGRRPSPAITRARSDDVAPHWFIQRRIGNQYRIAKVRIVRTTGRIGVLLVGLRDHQAASRVPIVGSRLLQELEHARVDDVASTGAHVVTTSRHEL